MAKCQKCNIKFPERLIAPMFVNGKTILNICPICALKIRNEMLKDAKNYLKKRKNK